MIRELNKKVAHLQEKLKHATNTDEKTTVEKEINVIHTRIVKIEKKIKIVREEVKTYDETLHHVGTHVEEHHHHHDHDEKGHHHTTKETKEATKKKLIKKKVQLEHYEEMIRELNKKVAHLQEKLKHATNTDEKTTVEKGDQRHPHQDCED